ncbi:MAG: hypothetical protein ACI9MC_000906 [Kiritimatiellia bacterium]|jgi:hypothetical protein
MRGRRRGIAGGLTVFLLIAAIGWWFWPSETNEQAPEPDVVAIRAQPVRAPPPSRPQVLRAFALEAPTDEPEHVSLVRERAEWAGTGLVWCDLSEVIDRDQDRLMGEMAHLLSNNGGIDPFSRAAQEIHNGSVLLAVTVPNAQASFFAFNGRHRASSGPKDTSYDDLDAPDMVWLTIRWREAAPGKTVGCDGVWANVAGRLKVLLLDEHNNPIDHLEDSIVFARGCGLIIPQNRTLFAVEAGRCALYTERRHPSFPFIKSRGELVQVTVHPGELTTVTLVVPPMPDLFTLPDFEEMDNAADILAFVGAGEAADLIDATMDQVMNGDFSGAADFVQQWQALYPINEDIDDDFEEDDEDEDDFEDDDDFDEDDFED